MVIRSFAGRTVSDCNRRAKSAEESQRLEPDSNGDERPETSDQQCDLEPQGRHLLLVVTQCHERQFAEQLEELTLTVQLISQSPFL